MDYNNLLPSKSKKTIYKKSTNARCRKKRVKVCSCTQQRLKPAMEHSSPFHCLVRTCSNSDIDPCYKNEDFEKENAYTADLRDIFHRLNMMKVEMAKEMAEIASSIQDQCEADGSKQRSYCVSLDAIIGMKSKPAKRKERESQDVLDFEIKPAEGISGIFGTKSMRI